MSILHNASVRLVPLSCVDGWKVTYPTKLLVSEKNHGSKAKSKDLRDVRNIPTQIDSARRTNAKMMKTSSIPNHLFITVRV